jgi:signal transduction histidine kinase
MSGILPLRSPSLSLLAVRDAAHRVGLPVIPEAASRAEFLDALRTGSVDVILAGVEVLPDLNLRELLERARSAQPPVPVILVGDSAGQAGAIRLLREGAADYLPASGLHRLPSTLVRALRERDSAAGQAGTQQELERAAAMLRDNQKLITVGHLAASIAHEINNPLESVTNLLYLLGEEKDLSDSARGYLALARRELDRVAQISRQTLNFARETAGPQRARIDELLEEVLSLYGRRIAEKNLEIRRSYDCQEEILVFPGEMRQVFSNLVTNAIEASERNGCLCLRVRSSHSLSDPGVRGIRVAVGDNGAGIPAVVRQRLGEPFFTTKGQRGTGLGLWVTRSIVQRYGGEIQLRSSTEPRRHGTVFSIFLPTNLGPRPVDRPRDSGDTGGGSRSKVLPLDAGSLRQRTAGEFPGKRRVNDD